MQQLETDKLKRTVEPQPTTEPYALPVEEVLKEHGVDAGLGLTEARVLERRTRYGPNELAAAPTISRWQKFLSQFKEVVVWILLVAAVFAGLTGEWTDALAILAIVLLNALLGFFQEEKAEQALTVLRKLSAPQAKVVRSGGVQTVRAHELVPGDCIELEAGDNVPADVRLVQASAFRTQEATLTGESEPVDKDPDRILGPFTPLADRRNMAYLGTLVASGKARAVVVATGMNTELGRIAGMLRRSEAVVTPLQRRLGELGRLLAVVCVVIAGIVFVLELLRGNRLTDVVLLAVSLAVAAVPEGLPAVVTVALTLGLQRMVKRNALIRKLPSVETLGSVTVICSDKTGTLTRNEMTVRQIIVGDRRFRFTGIGYNANGRIFADWEDSEKTDVHPVDLQTEPDLALALKIAARCNNARLSPQGIDSPDWQLIGDPTAGALLVAARKAGVEIDRDAQALLCEIPFDSERKAMSVVVRDSQAKALMYTKGAPEAVLGLCISELRQGHVELLTEDRRRAVLRNGAGMAAQALRVLALAFREDPIGSSNSYQEQGLTFVGLVGMLDPPREEAKVAVGRSHEAGIRPVMITGDHPATALAVARELRMVRADEQAVTGTQLDPCPTTNWPPRWTESRSTRAFLPNTNFGL